MKQLGQYVTRLAGSRILNIGIIEGLPGYPNTERLEGFLSGIDKTKVKVRGRRSGSWTAEGGLTASLDLLQEHPEVDAIVAASDDMAFGASSAAKSMGKQIVTTGVDGQTRTLEAIADRIITATVDVAPYRMVKLPCRSLWMHCGVNSKAAG